MGGEAARDPGRLRLELGVGDLGAVGDQRGAVGAALGSLGQPVVEFHRLDIVPIMPKRHKDAPPEEELYAPIEWRSAGEYEDIRYEKADGIAKITIDRPEVLNAFRPQTLIEISAALELAREDTEVGVVILTGAGEKAFCSGGDQQVRGDTGYVAEGASLGRFHVTDLQVQMRRLPKPVVAMVAGYAIGGGHILHLCCDLTIAADNAVFGQTGPRVGSWDGGFGASLLRDLVGTKKAKEFWLLCRQYDAEEALEMGLVNTVVPLDRPRSARRSPGAARCSRSRPSPCAWSRRASTPTRTATPGSSSSPTTPTCSSTAARRRRGPRGLQGEAHARLLAKFPRRP